VRNLGPSPVFQCGQVSLVGRRGSLAAAALAVALALPGAPAAASYIGVSIAPVSTSTVDQNGTVAFAVTGPYKQDAYNVCGKQPYWTFTATGGTVQYGAYGPDSCGGFIYVLAGYSPGTFSITASYVGYGVNSSGTASYTVNPLVIQVTGQQQTPQGENARITATLSGISSNYNGNTAVNWSLSPASGGILVPDSTSPSNTQSLTFTAGHTAGNYLLTAQSVQEPSVSGSMSLTVLPPPVESVSPTSATVAAGQYFTFTASPLYASNPNTSWYTDDPNGFVNVGGNGGTLGSFLHIVGKPGGQFHVTAVSVAGGTPATASVTVVAVNLLPSAVSVLPGTSRQFLAEVTGSQQATQWSTTVPGAAISASGLLQVPAGTATGSYAVSVQTVGTPVATATAAVTVAAAIPVTAVAVSPARSVIDSGQQEPFTAVVEGQNGEPNPNQAVVWSVSGPAPASIAANGLFTAPGASGVYTVTATAQADATKSGTATVTVGEDLLILPSSASLAPGASQPFQAQVSGVANPAVAWSLQEGSAGGAISAAGLYTAPAAPGVYHVIAVSSSGGLAVQGIATVVVGLGPRIEIVISPAEVAVSKGGTQQFSAAVTGSADAGVLWSASAGTIDATGLFTAPATFGTVTITATSHADSRVDATATAVVTDPSQAHAFQYDANGNLLADGTRTFEWDAENRLTAINAGNHRSELAYDGLGRRVQIVEKVPPPPGGSNYWIVTSRLHYLWVGNDIVEETDATAVPAASPGSGGFLDAADCNELVGWVWDATQPNTPLNVDIYDGSSIIATLPAKAYRGDLKAAGYGNGNHGFFYPTPASLKTGTSHSVTVKISGTSSVVGSRTVSCAAPSFAGSFDEADCTWLAAWAWDGSQPNSSINVDIYDGTTLIATVLASTFRQDLLNAGLGNGNHGFWYPTPPSLKTGTAHSVTLKVGGTSTVVGGTRTVSCSAPSIGGFLDVAACSQLTGWAWDGNQPNSPTNVDIYDGPTLIATVLATTFRQDLKNAGIGNGYHGFTYTSPSFNSGSSHSITVNFGGTATVLGTRSFFCPIEPVLTEFFPGGMRASGTSNYYFSQDHLGSVREVTDAGGNVVSRYDYDPYGRLTINQGTPPRFGFAGYFYHAPSGLSLTKYRAYDPDLGRWESRDPAYLAGGVNLYSYVDDDPIDGIDPLGLKKKPCRDPFAPLPRPKHLPMGPFPPLCTGQPLGKCPPAPPPPAPAPPKPEVPPLPPVPSSVPPYFGPEFPILPGPRIDPCRFDGGCYPRNPWCLNCIHPPDAPPEEGDQPHDEWPPVPSGIPPI
jgi:RHS repeat-associated protein